MTTYYKMTLALILFSIITLNKMTFSSNQYYKYVTIVNDASSGVNKLKASLNDAARSVIYDRHVFIIQARASFCKVM